MRLPLLPHPLPELKVTIQGPHSGSNCRVAIYRLVEFNEQLTWRRAEDWARRAVAAYREDGQAAC